LDEFRSYLPELSDFVGFTILQEAYQIPAVCQDGVFGQTCLDSQIVEEALDVLPQRQGEQLFANRLYLRWGHLLLESGRTSLPYLYAQHSNIGVKTSYPLVLSPGAEKQ
jgi:hypothetical protein